MSFPSPLPDTWLGTRDLPSRRSRSISKQADRTVIRDTYSPGLMDLAEVRKWNVAQMLRPNLAGKKDVHDRAVAWAASIKSEFESRTEGVRSLWRVLDLVAQGESTARVGDLDITASHEVLKAIERLVPRIEEALQRQDPWFRPRATDPEFAEHETDILGYMLQQLRNDHTKSLWQPLIRNMLLYQVGALKIWWERKTQPMVQSEVAEINDEMGTRYEITKRDVEALVFDGPRFQIVSPYSLVIDPDCTSPYNAMYVGDSRSRRLDELQYLERTGEYKNTAEIQENPQSGRQTGELSGFDEMVASLTKPHASGRILHGPKFVECLELWGAFDIHGDGKPVECQVVVANGSTCVLARENPLDGRSRPYAIGRTAKWSREFFNVGVMDIAVRVQDHLDVLRTITQQSTMLGMTPLVFTERTDASLPQSIQNAAPGSVFSGGGRIQLVTPTSDTRAHLPLHAQYRADIGELTGAPDNLSGTAQTDTATESVKNLEQANTRVAGLIREYASVWDQALTFQHLLNRQFTCAKVAWAAIGKSADVLMKHYGFVTPATFLGDVGFEFDGLASVYQKQSRAQGIAEWMRQWAPMLPMVGDQVNIVALMQRSYTELLGDHGRDIFRVAPMPQDLPDQFAENKGLAAGREIPVNPLDPHEEHIKGMQPLFAAIDSGKIKSVKVIQAVAKHLVWHLEAIQAVRNQAAVRENLRAQKEQPPEANAGSNKSSADGTDQTRVGQTPRGETPGAGSTQQMAKPGRNQPTPQAAQ